MLFRKLVSFGQRLTALHLLDSVKSKYSPTFPLSGTNQVDKIVYESPSTEHTGRVWINSKQYFEGIALQTWDCVIGGYRPAEKWLKDRKTRGEKELSFDEIKHYSSICGALAETLLVMSDIEKTIQTHSRWPLH